MCAIAGCSKADPSGATIGCMLDAMRHRGPDDGSSYYDHGSELSLGSRRLAIVDVEHGKQPVQIIWKGETYVGVYNGEVYNHHELKKELEAEGITFKSDCDTEVVIASFAFWGEKCLQRFEGQWAFAVWAVGSQKLFLARDPLGIKPLFWYQKDALFAFASEPKGLHANRDIPKRPNVTAIQEYFLHGLTFAAGYSLSHRSFFEDIHSLEPGHLLRWSPGSQATAHRYFDLADSMGSPITSETEATEALRDAVTSSVHASMMGERPIGLALSGGLDSSIITAVAAQKAAKDGQTLTACSITYPDQSLNEDYHHAALLRRHLADQGIQLKWGISEVKVKNYLDDVEKMILHFDEPHWEVKQLAMFRNYKELDAKSAKVILTGEGADELFFGYYHRFPGFKNPVITSPDQFESLWASRLPDAMSLFSAPSEDQFRGLIHTAIDRFYRPNFDRGMDSDRCMQVWYLSTFLHWLLIDNDRCSMAFSLEGRFPFLNKRVIDVALRIAPKLQIGTEYGQEKAILRLAFKDVLPEQIWKHRKKAPLPSPLNVAYHFKVDKALKAMIKAVPDSIWEVLDRKCIEHMSAEFHKKLRAIESSGSGEFDGEELTRYIPLSQKRELRTPQMFGILTLLIWWKQHFA